MKDVLGFTPTFLFVTRFKSPLLFKDINHSRQLVSFHCRPLLMSLLLLISNVIILILCNIDYTIHANMYNSNIIPACLRHFRGNNVNSKHNPIILQKLYAEAHERYRLSTPGITFTYDGNRFPASVPWVLVLEGFYSRISKSSRLSDSC